MSQVLKEPNFIQYSIYYVKPHKKEITYIHVCAVSSQTLSTTMASWKTVRCHSWIEHFMQKIKLGGLAPSCMNCYVLITCPVTVSRGIKLLYIVVRQWLELTIYWKDGWHAEAKYNNPFLNFFTTFSFSWSWCGCSLAQNQYFFFCCIQIHDWQCMFFLKKQAYFVSAWHT